MSKGSVTYRELLGLPSGANLREHRTYRIWSGMQNRSGKEWHHAFEKYQALGVYVCKRWTGSRGLEKFIQDMGHPPSERHSLERVRNTGPYSPRNCVWALPEQQNRNKSDTHCVKTPAGVMCAVQAAAWAGIPAHTLYRRLKKGVVGDALFAPPKKGAKNA